MSAESATPEQKSNSNNRMRKKIQSIVFIAVFKVLLFVNDSVLSYGDELVPVGMVLREAEIP